jgi:hypothetical protein
VTAKYGLISHLGVQWGCLWLDFCNSFVLNYLYNKFRQNTFLRYFLLTRVQFGQVGFEKKTYNT